MSSETAEHGQFHWRSQIPEGMQPGLFAIEQAEGSNIFPFMALIHEVHGLIKQSFLASSKVDSVIDFASAFQYGQTSGEQGLSKLEGSKENILEMGLFDFLLFSLKRIVGKNPSIALQIWTNIKTMQAKGFVLLSIPAKKMLEAEMWFVEQYDRYTKFRDLMKHVKDAANFIQTRGSVSENTVASQLTGVASFFSTPEQYLSLLGPDTPPPVYHNMSTGDNGATERPSNDLKISFS